MKNLMGLFVVSVLFLSAAAQAKTQVSFGYHANDSYSDVTYVSVRDGYLNSLGYMDSFGGKLRSVIPASNPANLQLMSDKESSKVTLDLEDGLYQLLVSGLRWRSGILIQVAKGKVSAQVQDSQGVKINLLAPVQ